MSRAPSAANASSLSQRFADRNSPIAATIIVERKGNARSLSLGPSSIAAIALVSLALIAGCFLSFAYFTLSDDLLSATLQRHARIQQAYEDRIAALRSQVDLATSRQLLDQKAIEDRVELLMAKQAELGSRAATLKSKLLAVPTRSTFQKPVTTPTPKSTLKFGSLIGTSDPFGSPATQVASVNFDAIPANEIIDDLEATLERTEKQQLAELDLLRQQTNRQVVKLATILKKQGIRVPADTAVGGPLIEMKDGDRFLRSVSALESSLETLEKVRLAAKSLPHGSPSPGHNISSHFGARKDPFTGRRAVHGGLDFRARRGAPVIATASGTVAKAGRHGGYGKLVEIDHGGGITTRYAHLSRILVKKGQRIVRGKRIGKVGSTGRSTGPHLHYEVRRKGGVLNPIHYVRLEKKLKPLL